MPPVEGHSPTLTSANRQSLEARAVKGAGTVSPLALLLKSLMGASTAEKKIGQRGRWQVVLQGVRREARGQPLEQASEREDFILCCGQTRDDPKRRMSVGQSKGRMLPVCKWSSSACRRCSRPRPRASQSRGADRAS